MGDLQLIAEMIKLEEANTADYLKSLDIFGDVDWEKIQVSEVTEYTNVNFVFSVLLRSLRYKKVYIKQAFGFVKIKPDFPAPIGRQRFEKLSIDYLQQYWKGRIPEVVHYDADNNILIITDVGEGAKLLVDEVKNGRLHFEIGPDLGLMMAELHAPTFDKDTYPVRGKKANKEHIDFIFDFRLGGSRKTLPEETEKLFQDSLKAKKSLIYADWATKNVFVSESKVRLVDFENLVRFDPAFDIGYALAHWVLDVSKENRSEMVEFFKDFEQSYTEKWESSYEKDLEGILARATRYLGAMMLHRLAGVKSTMRMEEYLAKEVPLLEIAKQLLCGGFSSPSLALEKISLT